MIHNGITNTNDHPLPNPFSTVVLTSQNLLENRKHFEQDPKQYKNNSILHHQSDLLNHRKRSPDDTLEVGTSTSLSPRTPDQSLAAYRRGSNELKNNNHNNNDNDNEENNNEKENNVVLPNHYRRGSLTRQGSDIHPSQAASSGDPMREENSPRGEREGRLPKEEGEEREVKDYGVVTGELESNTTPPCDLNNTVLPLPLFQRTAPHTPTPNIAGGLPPEHSFDTYYTTMQHYPTSSSMPTATVDTYGSTAFFCKEADKKETAGEERRDGKPTDHVEGSEGVPRTNLTLDKARSEFYRVSSDLKRKAEAEHIARASHPHHASPNTVRRVFSNDSIYDITADDAVVASASSLPAPPSLTDHFSGYCAVTKGKSANSIVYPPPSSTREERETLSNTRGEASGRFSSLMNFGSSRKTAASAPSEAKDTETSMKQKTSGGEGIFTFLHRFSTVPAPAVRLHPKETEEKMKTKEKKEEEEGHEESEVNQSSSRDLLSLIGANYVLPKGLTERRDSHWSRHKPTLLHSEEEDGDDESDSGGNEEEEQLKERTKKAGSPRPTTTANIVYAVHDSDRDDSQYLYYPGDDEKIEDILLDRSSSGEGSGSPPKPSGAAETAVPPPSGGPQRRKFLPAVEDTNTLSAGGFVAPEKGISMAYRNVDEGVSEMDNSETSDGDNEGGDDDNERQQTCHSLPSYPRATEVLSGSGGAFFKEGGPLQSRSSASLIQAKRRFSSSLHNSEHSVGTAEFGSLHSSSSASSLGAPPPPTTTTTTTTTNSNTNPTKKYYLDPNEESAQSFVMRVYTSIIKCIPRGKVPVERGYSMTDWSVRCREKQRNQPKGTSYRQRRIPVEEVRRHCTEDDLWMVIRGVVYDCTDFIAHHPGGRKLLLACGGREATAVYDAFHPWINAESMMEGYAVGILDSK